MIHWQNLDADRRMIGDVNAGRPRPFEGDPTTLPHAVGVYGYTLGLDGRFVTLYRTPQDDVRTRLFFAETKHAIHVVVVAEPLPQDPDVHHGVALIWELPPQESHLELAQSLGDREVIDATRGVPIEHVAEAPSWREYERVRAKSIARERGLE